MKNPNGKIERENFSYAIKAGLLGLFVGTLCSAVFMVICAAFFVSSGKLPKGAISAITLVIAGISAFAAGVTAARMQQKKGILIGSAAALFLSLLYLICGVLIIGEPLTIQAFTKLLIMTLCGAIGGIFGVNRKKNAGRKGKILRRSKKR